MTAGQATSGAVRVIGWPLTLVSLTYLVLVGGAYPGVFVPGFRMIDVAMAAGALGLWLVLNRVDGRWRPATVLWPAIGAIALAFAISTLTSALPRLSLEYLAFCVVVLALYALLVRLQAHPFIGPRLRASAMILLGLIGVIYLTETVTLWQAWWTLVGRVAVPQLRPGFESLGFGSESAVGATCVLLFVAGAASIGLGSASRRALVVGMSVVTLIICVLTGARSVWLGVAVMAALVGVLWVASRGPFRALKTAARNGRGRAVLVAGIVLVAAVAAMVGPMVLTRLGLADPSRVGLWLASLRMFWAAPLLGQGPGTWAVQRSSFTEVGDQDLYLPSAENVYVQTLGELGVVGVVAAIVVAVVVGRLIHRSLSGTAEQRRHAWAAIAAIAYLAAHQFVDVVTNLPVVLLAVALPISRLDALAIAAAAGGPTDPSGPRAAARTRSLAALPIVAAIIAGVAIATLAWTTRLAVMHQSAVDAANAGNWDTALALARDVATADQDMPVYHVTYGLALAHAGEPDAAGDELLKAASIDEFPQAWLDIAALDVAAGRIAAAHTALDRALRFGRQQAAIDLPAAVLYAKLGETDSAVDALARALRSAPSIASDPWWTSRSDLSAVHAAAVAQTVAEEGVPAFQIALETGQLDAAATALGTIVGDTTTFRLAFSAWSGDTAAYRQLQARASSIPLDLETIAWNVIAAGHAGDQVAVNRFRAWADLVSGGAGAAAIGFRIADGLTPLHDPAGSNGLTYGQYLYLRAIPRDELLGGLPQLVTP